MFKSENMGNLLISFVFCFFFYREHSLLISQQGESNKSKPVTVHIYKFKAVFFNFSLVITLFLVVQTLDRSLFSG